MYRSESFRGGKFLTTMLHVSKTLRPHLTHKTLLACPSLPFITDSMNWHTYLLEPEISWGGGPEGGVKKTTVQYLEAIWPQHSSSLRHSGHNSLHSAQTLRTELNAELWRKDLTSTSGWGQQRKWLSTLEVVVNVLGWWQKVSLNSFGWFSLLSWQDGNGKVSRVIRIGTRKSQVQCCTHSTGANFIQLFNMHHRWFKCMSWI